MRLLIGLVLLLVSCAGAAQPNVTPVIWQCVKNWPKNHPSVVHDCSDEPREVTPPTTGANK